MWRVKNNLVPTHIKNKFMLITDNNNRRKGNFSVRTSKKQKGFLVTGISSWNSLDRGQKSCNTIVQLKKKYKKYVLGKYEGSEA